MVEATGPAWTASGRPWGPADGPPPAVPVWALAHSFPKVWQDTLEIVGGGLSREAQRQFPDMSPSGPWNHHPKPNSEPDVAQAISAKLEIGRRALPLLTQAQLIVIEPDQIAVLPDWEDSDEAGTYAANARLPFPVVYFDFEGEIGQPVAWEAPTWPLPFHLRGALCWTGDSMLNIVPFGSVGGTHLHGGTDYQPWSRWVYLQSPDVELPHPGRGDFIAQEDGTVTPWVDIEGESFSAHQGSVGHNLAQRVLAAMYLLEAANVELVDQPITRQVRRQAERKGHRIGLAVEIRTKRSKSVPRDGTVDYSHRFDVRGHWRHYTDGAIFDAGTPKPCARCGRPCRRVWVPPYVKGPMNKPYVPKLRHWGESRHGASDV